MPEKEFTLWLSEGYIFAWRDIDGGRILGFRVVLLANVGGEMMCVARYDTAHGVSHQ